MIEEFTLIVWTGESSASYTLEALGVEAASLKIGGVGATSQADDALTLTVVAAVDATPFVAYGQKVELFSAGTRRFVGYARAPRPTARANAERLQYRFESPARFLRSTYRQAMFFTVSGVWTGQLQSTVVLNRSVDLSFGLPTPGSITVPAQLDALLTYGQTYGDGGAAAAFDYDLTGVPAITIPEQEKKSPTILECIEAVLRWTPNVSAYWDYSGATGSNPTLRFVTMTTIDGSGDPVVPPTLAGGGTPVIHSIPNDGTILEQFEPVAKDERLIKTIRIAWIADGMDGIRNALVYSTEESTIENGSPVVMNLTLELRGTVWNGASWVSPELVPSDNLARQLHMGFERPWWQFNATAHTEDLHWEWRPADLANITDAGSALAGANAVIQDITRDLKTGSVQLSTGTPTNRGLGELQAARRVTNGADNYGFRDPKALEGDPPPPSSEPLAIVPIPPTGTTALVRVNDGTFGGVLADPAMAGAGVVVAVDSFDGEGNAYILCHMTMSQDSFGIWSVTAREIIAEATVPANTDTDAYEVIGQVHVTGDGTAEAAATVIVQTAQGNQRFRRSGPAGNFIQDAWK